MSNDDQERESLRAELKALKEWLTVLNQEDPELRFRALVEKGSDGIAVVDAEGVIVYASPSMERLLGHSAQEQLGRNCFDSIHPENRAERLAQFAECLANPRKEFHSLVRCLHKDGSFRLLECISVNRLDEPCVQGIVVNARDVTEVIAARDEQRLRCEQQAAVADLGLAALRATSLDTLLDQTVRRVAEVLGVEFCKVMELLPEGDAFLLRAGVGWKPGYVRTAIVKADLDSQAGYTLLQNEPVLVADVRNEKRFKIPPLLEQHGVAAGMSVVIKLRDKPFGVLGTHTSNPRLFTQQDAIFLQAVANILAAAVEETRLETQLRDNESRLRLATDAADVGTWDRDLLTQQVTLSRCHEMLWGIPAGSFGGHYRDFEERIHPEDVNELNRVLDEALARRTFCAHEFRVVWPDGSVHWVAGRGHGIYDERGKPLRMVGIVMDISQRKQAEIEVARNEDRFRGYLRAADDAVVATDREGRIVLVNDHAERMFGYRQDELLGQAVEILVPQGLKRRHEAHREAYHEHPVMRPMQDRGPVVGRRKDGSEVTVVISLTPVQLRSEFLITATIRDVTAQLRSGELTTMQHAVTRVLAESGSLADVLPTALETICKAVGWDVGGIWIVDEQASVLRCYDVSQRAQDTAERFTARTREITFRSGIGLPGRVWESAEPAWIVDVVKDANFPRAPFAAADGLHGGVAFPIRVHGRVIAVMDFFSREIRQPDLRFMEVLDDVGSMIGQFIKRRQAEQLLLHSSKLAAVESLAGGVAHEFNNLLQSILGYTRYAMDGLDPSEVRYQDLRHALTATNRAAALTRQLLGFARRHPMESGLVDLNQLVREVHALMRPVIDNSIELTLDLADGLEPVLGDEGQLHQAVMNMCINARDAMPDGGTLRIRTRSVEAAAVARHDAGSSPAGPYVELTIADTGRGMPPEVKERVFEPFFTTKQAGQGTGLGMAVVHGIVQQHHGAIEIDSSPGQGTECRVFLPAASQPVQSESAPSDAETPNDRFGGDETVLVAEDEELLRDLLCRALRDAGYRTLAAADGNEAVSLYQAHAPTIAVAVLDLTMPGLNGYEVAAEIRKDRPEFPVILCTGYDPATLSPVPDAQHTRVVGKPTEWPVLLEAMREIMDASRVTQR